MKNGGRMMKRMERLTKGTLELLPDFPTFSWFAALRQSLKQMRPHCVCGSSKEQLANRSITKEKE